MQRKLWLVLLIGLIVPGLLMLTACQQKQPLAVDQGTDTGMSQQGGETTGAGTDQSGIDSDDLAAEAQRRAKAEARNRFVNEDVHFAFDSSALDDMARDILRRKAEWLMQNPGESVIIEGHCDERGTNEYNMALGDRRAASAQSFLVDLGVSPGRMSIISYGEEMPVDPGHNEEAWAKNRRAHFRVN